MKRVDELFPDFLRKQPARELPVEELVRRAWPRIAGRHIAAHSRMFRVYQDMLIVHVPDQEWRKQMMRLEGRLLGRLNKLLGREAIRSLEFRVDYNLVPAIPPATAPAVARGEELPAGQATAGASSAAPPRKGPGRELAPAAEADLQEMARAISDPELRELFVRASRRMMR